MTTKTTTTWIIDIQKRANVLRISRVRKEITVSYGIEVDPEDELFSQVSPQMPGRPTASGGAPEPRQHLEQPTAELSATTNRRSTDMSTWCSLLVSIFYPAPWVDTILREWWYISAFWATFSRVVPPPLFCLGRGPITPPGPAMVLTDRKDLN